MPLLADWPAIDQYVETEFKLRYGDWLPARATAEQRQECEDTAVAVQNDADISPYVRNILCLHENEENWNRTSDLTLKEHGVCIIETGGELRADIERLSRRFLVAHTTMPELQPGWYENGETAHLGGSAFLGWPSTFHSPVMREIRKLGARLTAQRLMDEGLVEADDYAHAIMDRTALRRGADATHSQVVSSESFHQDVSPYRDSRASVILGGWIVLDPRPQKFRCVTGTAFTPTQRLLAAHERYMNANNRKFKKASGGFATFAVTAPERNALRAASTDIEIPSYSIILFDERIVHEVYGTRAAPTDMRRQFLGFQANIAIERDGGDDDTEDDRAPDRGRSDSSERPPDALIEDQKQACRNLTVPLIKSGQRPGVMASAYQNFTRNIPRLRQWSDDVVIPALKRVVNWKSGPDRGTFKYNGPPTIITKSVLDYAPNFPTYTAEEVAFFDKKKISDFL